jgi:hypothetical protein
MLSTKQYCTVLYNIGKLSVRMRPERFGTVTVQIGSRSRNQFGVVEPVMFLDPDQNPADD